MNNIIDDTIIINTESLHLDDDDFFSFCQQNPDLRMERDSKKNIVFMSPLGALSGNYEINIGKQVAVWNDLLKSGFVFSSNTGFYLDNGAMRSPDVAWIIKERWDRLPLEEKEKFPHLCPDFIIELKSKTDSLKQLKNKMNEWMKNGCRLAFLIIPEEKKAIVYRANGTQTEKTFNEKISGEDVLPGFELDLSELK